MTEKLIGFITHHGSGTHALWMLCCEKLAKLRFEHRGAGSIPRHATVLDIPNRVATDYWLDGGDIGNVSHAIDFDQVEWISIADFLCWDFILSERDALVAFAEMYLTGNCRDFCNLLSTDFKYTSQWVFESITNRYSYERYIKDKMKVIREEEVKFVDYIGTWGDRPCLVLTQKSEKFQHDVTVFATVLGGMITSISLCMVPSSDDVRRCH